MELHFLSGSVPPTPDDGVKEPAPSSPDTAAKVIRVEQKPTYSPDELSIYGRDPQIQHLFSSAAASLGQILSQPNLSTLYSFYDYYRLPLDVIEFLIHYCVRNGHRDLRYMERVAQDWADHDIHSAQQAQDYVQRLDVYRPLLKTMGIHRYPTDEDCRTLDRLQQQYQMSTEMLMEACRRTQKRAKTPSFRYLEGILADWHKQGVHTMEALGTGPIRSMNRKQPPIVNIRPSVLPVPVLRISSSIIPSAVISIMISWKKNSLSFLIAILSETYI